MSSTLALFVRFRLNRRSWVFLSLPRSRFLDVTQRSPLFLRGAVRALQKTAARETRVCLGVAKTIVGVLLFFGAGGIVAFLLSLLYNAGNPWLPIQRQQSVAYGRSIRSSSLSVNSNKGLSSLRMVGSI